MKGSLPNEMQKPIPGELTETSSLLRVYAGVEMVELVELLAPSVGGIEAPKVRPIAALGNALGMRDEKPKALKGRPNSWDSLSPPWAASIPHIAFIELDFVFREKRSELFLKCLHAMGLVSNQGGLFVKNLHPDPVSSSPRRDWDAAPRSDHPASPRRHPAACAVLQ